jgi:hypothetical protein
MSPFKFKIKTRAEKENEALKCEQTKLGEWENLYKLVLIKANNFIFYCRSEEAKEKSQVKTRNAHKIR